MRRSILVFACKQSFKSIQPNNKSRPLIWLLQETLSIKTFGMLGSWNCNKIQFIILKQIEIIIDHTWWRHRVRNNPYWCEASEIHTDVDGRHIELIGENSMIDWGIQKEEKKRERQNATGKHQRMQLIWPPTMIEYYRLMWTVSSLAFDVWCRCCCSAHA